MQPIAVLLAASLLLLPLSSAQAKTVCTVVADAASGAILLEQGDCRTRVTPASTFKLALSVMGFDAGILADPTTPTLPFQPGDPDWGGAEWQQPTNPVRWMQHSVVWFSQRITGQLGVERLQDYAEQFGYGNADFSGDPGQDNALERAWISSSLQIAPVEQVAFLRNLVNGSLPVDPRAIAMTRAIVQTSSTSAGWTLAGKTGSAYPRRADGSFDRAKGWGWFVGWAERGPDRLVFAQLLQDERRERVSGGIRARETLLKSWDELVVMEPK
jgi:beta-lactamase class D